jgi:signal transduction histidine kinase/CheY-like chemotaxis protein
MPAHAERAMHVAQLRLLAIDDDPDDLLLLRDALRQGGVRVPPVCASTLDGALAALAEGPFDACLLDENLGAVRAVEVLGRLRAAGCDAPVLIVTGTEDDALEERLLRAGAQDWLPKDELGPALLVRALRHAIERDTTARALDESRSMAATALDAMPHLACVLDRDGRIAAVNAPWRQRAAAEPAALPADGLGADYFEVVDRAIASGCEAAREVRAALARVRDGREDHAEAEYDAAVLAGDGEEERRIVRLVVTPFTADAVPRRLLLIHEDVTVARRTETARRTGQKMEALGQLAGAISHDFNNLLTSIRLNAEALAAELDAADPRAEDVGDLLRAVDQAGALTRRLLAFGRRQVLQLATHDLGLVLHEQERLLRRVIPESIAIAVRTEETEFPVTADDAQLMQAVLNLAINARDAMPGGGTLTIELSRLDVAGPALRDDGAMLLPGAWAWLRVRDTGTGIAPTVLPRIFEPFFTTKGTERGTGLGLAIVHGIVHQLGGRVGVESEPGEGTTFHLYLPLATAPVAPAEGGALPATSAGGTLLVVEDEPRVRALLVRFLEGCGFTVHAAANGREALLLLETVGPVDLVISDVVMPEMGGGDLAAALRLRWPTLPVLFISGYPEDASVVAAASQGRAGFLQKPFATSELLRQVALVRAAAT